MIDFNRLPKITFIVIHSRDRWFEGCIKSIKQSYYPNKEIKVVENMERDKTIGKCWNDAVKEAKGDWCMFIGDDDAIMPDYPMSSALAFMDMKRKKSDMHGIVSFNMAINVEKGRMTPALMWVTGMWEKEFLLKHPFDESLQKKVDYHWMLDVGKANSQIQTWNFGYIYRQHKDQVSGINLDEKAIKYWDNKKELKK